MGIREALRNFAEQIRLVNPSSQGGQNASRKPAGVTPKKVAERNGISVKEPTPQSGIVAQYAEQNKTIPWPAISQYNAYNDPTTREQAAAAMVDLGFGPGKRYDFGAQPETEPGDTERNKTIPWVAKEEDAAYEGPALDPNFTKTLTGDSTNKGRNVVRQVGASREDKGSVTPLTPAIPGAHAILLSDIFDRNIGKTNSNLVNGPSALNRSNFNDTNPFRQIQPGFRAMGTGGGGTSGGGGAFGGDDAGKPNPINQVGAARENGFIPGNNPTQGGNPSYIDEVRRASSGDTPSGIPDASLPSDGSEDNPNRSGGAVVGEDDEDRGPTDNGSEDNGSTDDGTTPVSDEKRNQGPLNDAEVAAMEQEFIDETLGGKYENWQDFQFNGTYDEWKQAADELASLAWIYDQYGEEGFDQYWEDATGFDPYLYQFSPMDEDQYQLYQNFMGTVDQDWEAMAQWLIDNGYRQYVTDSANPTEDAVNWMVNSFHDDDYGTYRDAEDGYTADMLLNDLLMQYLYGAAYNQRSTGLSEADINNIMGYMDVDTRFTTNPDDLTEDQVAQGSVYRSLPSDYNVMLPDFQQVYDMQEDPYRFTGTLLNLNNPDYIWYLEGE